MKIIIPHSLGAWSVYSHDDMTTVPEGAITWDGLMSAGWKKEGHARAYLKRLAKSQPDSCSEWHIVFDATVNRYFIYVRSRTTKELRAEAQELIKQANHADVMNGGTSVAGKAFRNMAQVLFDKLACSCPFPGGVPEKSVKCPVHGSAQ